jgi:ceramide glucosyltransferase
VLLNLWQWYAGQRFSFGRRAKKADFEPPLSILRPLKGCDAETERCLESWFTQQYRGEYELLFAVASETDPVCEIVRRLIRRYPSHSTDLLVCPAILGTNAKVSSLCHIAKRAQHEHIVISDQDVFIPPDFLAHLVHPLSDRTVGLVNCFYRLARPRGVAMRLEAIAVNADFWSQVLQRNMLKPMDFALGAAMATSKSRLAEIGGFEALVDYLADDYQLGNRIAKTGARLELCTVPVECHAERQSAWAVWNRQLRWARTIRVCQPAPYFLSVLSNGTFWPLLAAVANRSFGMACFVSALIVRMLTAAANYHRLTGNRPYKAGLLAPVKDLLHVAVWASAFIGNEITWRDQRFRVDKCGKLTPKA